MPLLEILVFLAGFTISCYEAPRRIDILVADRESERMRIAHWLVLPTLTSIIFSILHRINGVVVTWVVAIP